MRDFDKEREATLAGMSVEDRQFRVRGQVFTVSLNVRPEVVASWDDLNPGMLVTEGEGDEAYERPLTSVEFIGRVDDVLCQFLEGDGPKRWRKLRERDTDPVTYPELQEIMKLAVRVVTGRPLEVPSASSDTPEPTGTFSTVEPRSPALT
jgi:hypothetical protein